MKARDLATESEADLQKRLDDLKAEVFNLRFQRATGQMDNPLRFREIRRDIARIKTVQRARQA